MGQRKKGSLGASTGGPVGNSGVACFNAPAPDALAHKPNNVIAVAPRSRQVTQPINAGRHLYSESFKEQYTETCSMFHVQKEGKMSPVIISYSPPIPNWVCAGQLAGIYESLRRVCRHFYCPI